MGKEKWENETSHPDFIGTHENVYPWCVPCLPNRQAFVTLENNKFNQIEKQHSFLDFRIQYLSLQAFKKLKMNGEWIAVGNVTIYTKK